MKAKTKALQRLKRSEKEAVRDYTKAGRKYPENKGTFKHIRSEEKEHYRELSEIKK